MSKAQLHCFPVAGGKFGIIISIKCNERTGGNFFLAYTKVGMRVLKADSTRDDLRHARQIRTLKPTPYGSDRGPEPLLTQGKFGGYSVQGVSFPVQYAKNPLLQLTRIQT
jgi:hypothetical protein